MKTSENKAPLPRVNVAGEPIHMNGELIANGGIPSTGAKITLDGITKVVTTLDELNKLFGILLTSGSATVYISRGDFLPIQDNDLKKRLSPFVVCVGKNQKNGEPVFKPAFKYWTENANRHVYRRVVFSSKPQSADTYNLFRGLGVKPRKGTCLRILNHLKEVICSDIVDDYHELLKLIAWQLQNIGQPSRIIVILLTEKQQAGKGFLIENILLKIYGPSGFNATTSDQVFGKFNDAVLQGALADQVGIHWAFILPALCYLYVIYFALRGSGRRLAVL